MASLVIHQGVRALVLLSATLTGCGGGSGGIGGGESRTLYLSLNYPNGMANLWQPTTLVPQITGLDGNAPSCSLVSGRVPAGMALQEDCTITGTPQELGNSSSTIRITVRGFQGQVDTALALSVLGPSTDYKLGTFAGVVRLVVGAAVSELPGRTVNGQWANWVPQAGQSVAYRLSEGTLPQGLAINGNNGGLTGVPAATGAYTFTLAALASQGSATASTSTAYRVDVSLPDVSSGYERTRTTPYAVGDVVSTVPTSRFGSGLNPADFRFTYSSRSDSAPLPPGLSLNPQTGEIGGTLTGPVRSQRGEAVIYEHVVVVQVATRGVSFELPAILWQASITPPPLKPGDGFLPAPTSTNAPSAMWQRTYTTTVETQYAQAVKLYERLATLTGPTKFGNTVQFEYDNVPFDGARKALSFTPERVGQPQVINEATVLPKPVLAPGLYVGTIAAGNPEGAAPSMGVGCNGIGAFQVHEVEFAADGTPRKLAADYAQPCAGGGTTFLMGAIRHNSTVPLALDVLYAVPGRSGDVLEGTPFLLNGSASWSPVSPVIDWQWRQISGPAFDLGDCKTQAPTCATYVPTVSAGGDTAVFELQVTTLSGRIATARLNLRIRSTADRQSLAQQRSANGRVATTTGSDVLFSVPTKFGTESIYLLQRADHFYISAVGNRQPDDTTVNAATLAASTPDGKPFAAPQALSGTGPAIANAFGSEFSAGVPPPSCSITAWDMSLASLVRDPTDYTVVRQLAVWFNVRCPSGESLFSRFWIDYQPVNPPTARASGPATVPRGAPFTLIDAGSSSAFGPLKARLWTQIYGPAAKSVVQLQDGGLQVTPADNTPDGTRMVFVLEAADVRGQPGVATVRVVVTGGPAPLRVDGQRPASIR